MNDDLSDLMAGLNDLPRNLRGSLKPNLPFTQLEPRGWRDVSRCLFGFHHVTLSGRDAGMFIERCSCGAMRVNRRHWFDAHPFRITDAQGHTRRQRKIQRQMGEVVDRAMEKHFPNERR